MSISNKQELEAWILSFLATEQRSLLSAADVIEKVPRSLILGVPSTELVYQLMLDMQVRNLIGSIMGAGEYASFTICPDGTLYFRKFLDPLISIAQDEKKYSEIIDRTEGTAETKKEFKKFLKTLKGKLPDQASDEIIDFLKRTGKEAIFYAIRLIIEN